MFSDFGLLRYYNGFNLDSEARHPYQEHCLLQPYEF